MEVWSIKFGASFQSLPVTRTNSWSPLKVVGLCGCVSDTSIIEFCRTQVNLLGTFSPPCQSWSKGGKRGGLEDRNGFAFLEALRLAFSLQMVAIAAECADDIVSHPQFSIVKALAHALGYRLAWDQVTPFHPMSSHAHIRADAATQMLPFQLKLPMIPRSRWTDQAYQFPLPHRWSSQLKLSPSECETYDSVQFLPPAKRPRYENKSLMRNEIIRSRVPDASDILPTLCASYTRQHQLAEVHLAQKGIVACLTEIAQGFSFFDAAMFCSLFGATESVVLSEKIGESFLFVGHAITVPHSILALSIVLHATSACKVDPVGLVRQAWSDRLTAYKAILFADQGLVHLIPVKDFWQCAKLSTSNQGNNPDKPWLFVGTCADRQFAFQVSPKQTIREAFREQVQAPSGLIDQVCGLNEDIQILHSSTFEQIVNQERAFRLVIGHATLGTCEIRTQCTVSRTKVISHSQEAHHPPEEVPFVLLDLDARSSSSIFWAIQDVVETLQDDGGAKDATASVIVLPENLGVTTFVPSNSHVDALRQISDLPIFRNRNKRLVSIPGEANAYLLLTDAPHFEDSQSVEVILRHKNQFVGGARIPSQVEQIYSQIKSTGLHLRLQAIIGSEPDHQPLQLNNGDILDMCHAASTSAGGITSTLQLRHLCLPLLTSRPELNSYVTPMDGLRRTRCSITLKHCNGNKIGSSLELRNCGTSPKGISRNLFLESCVF